MSDTIAVIDIGTNSALLLIVRRVGSELVSLCEEARTPRLGAGLAATGQIGPIPQLRLNRTLRSYLRTCKAHGTSTVIAVGTRVFRTAHNARKVVRQIARHTGLRIRVLSAKEEASYAFRGALSGLPDVRHGVMVDIGGGSSELVLFRRRKIVSTLSLPLGCVTLGEMQLRRFCAISDRRLEAARSAVQLSFSQIPREYRQHSTSIIGVGGTITTLAAWELKLRAYRADRVHRYVLSREHIEHDVRRFRELSSAEIKRRIPYDPRRAAVLPAGTFLWAEVLNHLGAQWVTVSHRGLRWGIAQEYFATAAK